jgi:hypothetical protein
VGASGICGLRAGSHLPPVLLGSGERMFDGVENSGFEPVEVLHSPLSTHIRYRQSGLITPHF